MKKTDICASVLYDAMVTINGIPKLLKLSSSEIEALKDNEDKGKAAKEYLLALDEKSIFMTEDDALEELFPKKKLLEKLARLKSLFLYQILPYYNIDIKGRDREQVYADLAQANLYTGGDYYNVVWEILQNESISLQDLKDEIWVNCRIGHINEDMEITRVMFRPITSQISDLKKFSMENLFYTDNQYKNGLNNLFAIGVISADEVDHILKMIHFIAKEIDLKISYISSMYNELRTMQITNNKEAELRTITSEPTNENTDDISAGAPITMNQYIELKRLGFMINIKHDTLCYFISNKELPEQSKRCLWTGSAADAIRFGDNFGIKVSELKKAFYVKKRNGDPRDIKDNDRKSSTTSKLTDVFTKKEAT